MAQDGKVIINIDSNASKVARDFQNLTNDTSKYERILKNVAGTSNATLPIYDKIRAKLKEQQAAANSAITSYQKLANAQKSGVGFNQLNSVTGSAIERLRNLALQGRQNSAEFQNLASVVRSANSQMQNANNVVNAAISGSKGLSGALGSLGGSLGSLGGLAAGAAAGFAAMKLKDYGQYALQTSAAFEQLAISFRVMTGSAQTGQELTDAIIELGAQTPMTAQQLSKAAQLLLSFGESAENIIPDLKLLGDITGGEVNRFNMLALAFAQVGANGKLMGQDLLQMVNAGFNPLQIMSQTTGKSMGELRKEMEEGRISFQMVAQAMRDAASEGGRYFGLMEQQSQSLNGLLSTMGDTWEQVAKNIGDLFLPVAKSAVQGLISLGEAVLNLQNKMKAFTAGLRHETADSNYKLAEGYRKQAAELQQVAKDYEQRGNANWAASYRKKAQQFLDEATRLQQKAQQIEKKAQKSVLSQSGTNTGFNATVLSSGSDKKGREKRQLTISEKLQKSYNEEYRRLQDLAVQGVTSGKVWDSQVAKVNNLSNALERMKQVTDLSVVPPFQALNTEIQKAQERVNNLAASKIVNLNELKQAKTELTTLQKKLYDVQQAATTSPYQQKQNQISYLQSQLQDMAISGQAGSAGFNALKNQLKQAQSEITKANAAVQNSVGLTWSSISGTISSQLSYALTTPLQEGENAFERFGNVALNIISQIGQSLISQVLNNAIEKIAARGTDGVMTGAAAAVTQTAQGYASMAASTNMAALGISKIASSQTAATAALTSSAATVASAAATYKTAAVSAGQLASSITQAAISQAAYSAALVPIAGAALAPVAALATGTSIAAANVVASAGMLASRITAFKDGGVVNSPTLFPMAGNRTGLMGERGAEAIMPLKRTPSGQLGVQAQTSPATVNVYNQSDSKIETVQRPDGDTDIFIRRVNNALRNERTQAGFSSALQRNQSRGVQAS